MVPIRKPSGAELELCRLYRGIAEKTDLAGRHPEIVRRFDEFLSTARTESPEWPIRHHSADDIVLDPFAGED